MSTESVDQDTHSQYQVESRTHASSTSADNLNTVGEPDEAEVRQYFQDLAVASELESFVKRLRADGRLPEDVDILFCDDMLDIPDLPDDELVTQSIGGVLLSRLIDIERAGFEREGYGHRVEQARFVRDAFRGCADHGPLRFVIIARRDSNGEEQSWRPLAFFDYFRTSQHVGPQYTAAAEGWQSTRPNIRPDIIVVSKMAADPALLRDRNLVVLPGQVFAAVIKALANTDSTGVFVETEAQRASRRLVLRHLGLYLQGLEVLLDAELSDEEMKDKGPGGRPAKMLGHVPSDNGKLNV